MIRRAQDVDTEFITGMRGGKGEVEIKRFLKSEEFHDKGRLFGRITLKPGTSIGLHQHVGDCETFYILEGKGKFHDNGSVHEVSAGDVLYTDNKEEHSIENAGDTNLVLIALILYA